MKRLICDNNSITVFRTDIHVMDVSVTQKEQLCAYVILNFICDKRPLKTKSDR